LPSFSAAARMPHASVGAGQFVGTGVVREGIGGVGTWFE
jgi:hypothetical protein